MPSDELRQVRSGTWEPVPSDLDDLDAALARAEETLDEYERYPLVEPGDKVARGFLARWIGAVKGLMDIIENPMSEAALDEEQARKIEEVFADFVAAFPGEEAKSGSHD